MSWHVIRPPAAFLQYSKFPNLTCDLFNQSEQEQWKGDDCHIKLQMKTTAENGIRAITGASESFRASAAPWLQPVIISVSKRI